MAYEAQTSDKESTLSSRLYIAVIITAMMTPRGIIGSLYGKTQYVGNDGSGVAGV